MNVDTLVVGYVPIVDPSGKKSRELKFDQYYKDLFSSFDLGTIHYASHHDWKAKVDEVNPLVIIVLGGEYYASEIKSYKNDALIYVGDDAGSVFYRKAEIEEKKKHNIVICTEVEKIVSRVKAGEDDVASIRMFAALSYKDMYDMIIRAIIGDDESLRKQAWELLNDNNAHRNFLWMRIQLMAETWEHSDGKQREELMCMSMNEHIDNGTARMMDPFTDLDGQQYHQYMFLDPYGNDLNYIRRLPYGTKGQDRFAYESLLEKNEIPTNFIRVQLEANQLKEQWGKYLQEQDKATEK